MKLENLKSADQKRQRIVEFIAEHTEIFSRRGAVVETWREYAGRRQGPYFSLIFRQAGRQRSLYLGSDPRLADAVRELLERARRRCGSRGLQNARGPAWKLNCDGIRLRGMPNSVHTAFN